MDQASLLREMMKGMQQENCDSVALLSTSDVDEAKEFTKLFSDFLAKRLQKNVAVMGIPESGLTIIDLLINEIEVEKIKEKIHLNVDYIPGSLEFVSKIRNNKELMESFIKHIKEIEKKSEMILYYAGEGLEPTAINLSLATDKVIILMKPTEKSFMEVCNYIKIFSKRDNQKNVGIIVDTSEKQIFKEQFDKLQEYCWSEFKYNIEPVGFFETRYLSLFEDSRIFEGFDLTHLTNKEKVKVFSDSIYSMTL